MKKTVLLMVITSLFLSFFNEASGQNNPEKNRPPERKKYSIKILIGEQKMILYEIKDGSLAEIREYSVATAKNGLDVYPVGKGIVTKTELDPFWYPTPKTINHLAEKGIHVGEKVSPGDPNNFMGSFKIHLSHCTSRGCIYRIHGNNDESQIGKRVTGGCIRMKNSEGLELVKIIPIGTKVEIVNPVTTDSSVPPKNKRLQN